MKLILTGFWMEAVLGTNGVHFCQRKHDRKPKRMEREPYLHGNRQNPLICEVLYLFSVFFTEIFFFQAGLWCVAVMNHFREEVENSYWDIKLDGVGSPESSDCGVCDRNLLSDSLPWDSLLLLMAECRTTIFSSYIIAVAILIVLLKANIMQYYAAITRLLLGFALTHSTYFFSVLQTIECQNLPTASAYI